MAVTITRSVWIDDDGTGTTGTVINQALHTTLYNEIDTALAKLAPMTGVDVKIPGAYYEANRTTPIGYPIVVPYNAGRYSAFGGGTWTVPSGNVQLEAYTLVGRMAIYQFFVSDSTIAGSVSQLAITSPVAGSVYGVGMAGIGSAEVATVYGAAGVLYVIRQGIATFPIGSTGTIRFSVVLFT